MNADAWGGSWGTPSAWGVSWGVGVIPPVPPQPIQGQGSGYVGPSKEERKKKRRRREEEALIVLGVI